MTAHAGTAAGPDAPSVGLTRRDLLGIVALIWAPETKGQPLPED